MTSQLIIKTPYFEESIYIAPTGLPDKTQKEIVNLIGKACKKLGLKKWTFYTLNFKKYIIRKYS
ncbi:MAG: hypothetical protein Ct9H90mP10_05850 [Actinomycetota bacterium]|nr:MAG: hypothetical protein Ct9H90mP10_05850 [Actinomycetota bacterium]